MWTLKYVSPVVRIYPATLQSLPSQIKSTQPHFGLFLSKSRLNAQPSENRASTAAVAGVEYGVSALECFGFCLD